MTEVELTEMHKNCTNNRASIKKGAKAGCFFCLEIFPKEDVREYTSQGRKAVNESALCPRCGIDSVLSQSLFASVPELKKALREMQIHWFEK